MNAPVSPSALQPDLALEHVTHSWEDGIVAQLQDYIAMPAKSPAFDPQWAAHGWLDKVLLHAATWIEDQKIPGLTLEVVRLPGRTPVLMFEVAATRAASAETILLYGHMDKQPEFDGWRADLGPWTPKIVGDKLYGRGSADDGYAVYASIAAIAALKAQNIPHPRMVGLIETCEESGSGDLLPYIDALRARLGEVALVICLDSGAGNYDHQFAWHGQRCAQGTGADRRRSFRGRIGFGAFEFSHHAPVARPARRQPDGPLIATELSL